MFNNLIATNKPVAKWSKMTGKLQHIPALNTSPLDNVFCQSMHTSKKENICNHCYSVKSLKGYRRNCDSRFRENGQVLSSGPITGNDIERLPPVRIARFSGHGELHNLTHLENLYRIAEFFPETTFALWTKRNSLVRITGSKRKETGLPHRPDNVILIYSNPKINDVMTKPPAGFDKVFNNTTEITAADNCTGRNCADCQQCYTLKGPVCIVEKIK